MSAAKREGREGREAREGLGDLSLLEAMRVQTLRLYGRQNVLADALGTSSQYVSLVLTGRRMPTQRLLDALGIEVIVKWRLKE